MADLVQSLIAPHSSQAQTLHLSSSNESFHSSKSQMVGYTEDTDRISQNASLGIYDLNEYLKKPKNAALLASTGIKRKAPSPKSSRKSLATSNDALEAKPIGTSTSHYVSTLNQLCQAKGLPNPVFELEQSAEDHGTLWHGVVRIGSTVIGSPLKWQNKKGARESLSEGALPKVREMDAKWQERSSSGGERTKNWIGLLQEFHDAAQLSPAYTFFALGSNFSATCVIPTHPNHTFGSKDEPYPNKKSAQAASAKEAVEFLIKEGQLDGDGHPFRKRNPATGSVSPASSANPYQPLRVSPNLVEVPKACASLPRRVAEMAVLLGLQAPQYHTSSASPSAPNMLDGHATFQNAESNPATERLRGPVAEVRNMFGKKNAREEIARGVWEALKTVAESRGFEVREVES